MKKLLKSDLIKVIFPIIILPVSSTAIGLLISSANKEIGLTGVLLGILVVLIILLILCFSAYSFIKKIATDIVKNSAKNIALEAIKSYEEKQKIAEVISSELLTLNDILDIEKSASYKDKKLIGVDIIASSFNYDLTDEYGKKNCFRDVVVQNIGKHIKYNFYVTDNAECIIYMNDLNSLCKNKLTWSVIDNRFFLLMKDFDFTIYTLEDNHGVPERVGFMPLNNLFSSDEAKELYHVAMSDIQVRTIISMLPGSVVRKEGPVK